MHSIKKIFLPLLFLACSLISQAQVQTDTTQNKTKFFDKIGHWVTAYMLGGPDFMQAQRNDFKSSAFAELYIEGSIVKDVWMFNMLNRITEMRHEQKQTPHILIKILLKPENEALSLYSVNLNVTASQNLPINLNTIASQAVSKHLNKTPYSEPAYAVDDIEKALEEIFQNLKTALGNSLAPNLLLRHNNDIYWSGHEITVLANEGNSVELEALDKNLQPIPSAQLSWTNALPFTHKGVVDLTNISSQQVSVRRQQQGSQPDNAIVTLKRVNVTEDINDLLKALIIEVLSAKKEEVQDTLNNLIQNRTENAEKIKQYIANLERYNFPMEGPTSGSLMFPTPLYRADSAALMNTDNEQTRNIATSILALKKQKAIKRKIKIKANVAAFADLVVDNPERLEDLLDQLLRNSGSLIAQLILNRDNSGTRQTARNIVVDFINRNIERIAGSAAMATPTEAEPALEIPVLPSAAPGFDPARRLYLSASLPANTRQELESALSDYLNNLEEPLYVFVNYSHDANTENYLSRAIGNKPVGIPEGARYKVYTIINIPGSIMENVVGEAGEVTATTTKGGIVEGVMREDSPLSELPFLLIDEVEFLLTIPTEAQNISNHYTYITPSGHPITLHANIRPSLTGRTNNTEANRLIPKGVLLGFKEGEEIYIATFKKTASTFSFHGYKSKSNNTLYNGDAYSATLPASYKVIIARENDAECTIDLGIANFTVPHLAITAENPQPVSSSLSVTSLNPQYKSWGIPVAKCNKTPPNFTYTALLKESSGVIYPYGEGALLFTNNRFIYRGIGTDAVEYYLFWDGTKWEPFSLRVEEFQPLLAVLAIWLELLKDPHFTLDALGSVPVFGEAADALNGVIYYVEGDEVNAWISFAGTLPIAGEGLKHSLRSVKGFIKNGKYTLHAAEFSEEMAQVYAFLRNSSAVSSENFIQAYRNINTLAVHYGEPAQRALTLLSKSATDKVIFIKVVDKLKQLDESIGGNLTAFFDDIITNPTLATAFARNEGLVDSWKALDKIGVDDVIRKNPDYLKNIDDYAKRSGKNADEVADLAKNNENGIEQFLDELEDTPASGHWDKNPFQRGKDIEDDLGQNLPETFKTVDKYDDVTGEVTSIKSIDLDAKTYQTDSKLRSRLNKYLHELNVFQGYSIEGVNIGNVFNGRPINSKSLEIAIPRAATGSQLSIINDIVSSGASRGITVKVVVIQ